MKNIIYYFIDGIKIMMVLAMIIIILICAWLSACSIIENYGVMSLIYIVLFIIVAIIIGYLFKDCEL